MSQADNRDDETPHVQDRRLSESELKFDDSSWPLFTMYSKIAEEEDNKMVERWQKDAEGIIIFTGLFSAVLAALVVVSVQDIRPNPQDTSAFYLGKMYELQADPNASRPSIPSPLAKPPTFSPPRYAVWVNSLWFLSLVISLTCAMLAMLLQQWARRYIRATQLPRCSPEKRARMHAFFAHGVKKFRVDWAVEALSALIHLSLLTFSAGLLIFLHNVNHDVFSVVLCGVVLSSAVYVCITLMPIFWLDSPYYAPLSSTVWLLYATVWYTFWKLRAMIVWKFSRGPDYLTWYSFTEMKDRCRGWILGGLGRATEEMVSYLSSELDSRVVDRTVDALSEDDDLEKFFECPHGYYLPDYVNHVPRHQPPEVQKKIEAI